MADLAAQLMQRVEDGQIELIVSAVAIAEVVWVLSSFYEYAPREISSLISTFLADDGIVSTQKTELLRALTLYEDKNIDFIDCLIEAEMVTEGIADIYSFDKHFDRLENVRRLIPG
jgi:uncharacterized protein